MNKVYNFFILQTDLFWFVGEVVKNKEVLKKPYIPLKLGVIF